jgi:hypothetical protein
MLSTSIRRPKRRLQLTPLRVREIGAFLKRSFGANATSLYHCGATEAQDVGRQKHS